MSITIKIHLSQKFFSVYKSNIPNNRPTSRIEWKIILMISVNSFLERKTNSQWPSFLYKYNNSEDQIAIYVWKYNTNNKTVVKNY